MALTPSQASLYLEPDCNDIPAIEWMVVYKEMREFQVIENKPVDLLGKLDERQFAEVHAIIVEPSINSIDSNSLLNIQNEDQLWEHIDHSLNQAKSGIGREADEVFDDLMRKYAM